jgi:hypothetical protein
MQLNDWPTSRRAARVSVVDTLPAEVRAQLVEARLAGSHSVSVMVEWLQSEGYDQVSPGALSGWFLSRNIKAGAGADA